MTPTEFWLVFMGLWAFFEYRAWRIIHRRFYDWKALGWCPDD